jgi:predicted RNA binding protein YcfA (HicA-like mRNA interferase family)
MPHLTPIKRTRFEKFLVFLGCQLKRQKGDHLVYDRAGLKRPVILTTDREVPVFIIRNNLRTLAISVKEYLEIIRRVR